MSLCVFTYDVVVTSHSEIHVPTCCILCLVTMYLCVGVCVCVCVYVCVCCVYVRVRMVNHCECSRSCGISHMSTY